MAGQSDKIKIITILKSEEKRNKLSACHKSVMLGVINNAQHGQ